MINSKPLVSIIIVCWNSSRVIVDCLNSIYRFSAKRDYEIIVVDNASGDRTAEIVAEHFPEVKVVQAGGNLGFPRANNLAIRRAQGDFLFLLNPDTCFKSDVIGTLVTFIRQNPAAGAVCPKIIERDGTISKFAIRDLPSLSGYFFTEFGLRKCFPKSAVFAKGLQVDWDGTTPRRVSFIAGAAIMIPRTVISETGLLDEQLPMYFEDLDLSARIRKTGKPLYVVPEAVVLHLGGQSSQLSPAHSQLLALENGQAPWLYMKTYCGDRHAALFTCTIFAASTLRLCATIPLFGCGMFSPSCSSVAKRQAARSLALLKWALSEKSKFVDRLATFSSN